MSGSNCGLGPHVTEAEVTDFLAFYHVAEEVFIHISQFSPIWHDAYIFSRFNLLNRLHKQPLCLRTKFDSLLFSDFKVFVFNKGLILRNINFYECLETMEYNMVGVFKCQICLCRQSVLWIIGTFNSVVATCVCV